MELKTIRLYFFFWCVVSFLFFQTKISVGGNAKIGSISAEFKSEDQFCWYYTLSWSASNVENRSNIWYTFWTEPVFGDAGHLPSRWQVNANNVTELSTTIALSKAWNRVCSLSPIKIVGGIQEGLFNPSSRDTETYLQLSCDTDEKIDPCDQIPLLNNDLNQKGYPVLSIMPTTLNVIAYDIPLWYRGGNGPDIEIKLTYNANGNTNFKKDKFSQINYYPFGPKWSCSYGCYYMKHYDNYLICMPEGRIDLFVYDSTKKQFDPPEGTYNTLEKIDDELILTEKYLKLKYHFNDTTHQKLTSIEDINGNIITFHYDANYNLDYLIDANGRKVEILLNPVSNLITEIKDPIGRTAKFAYNSEGYLVSITDMGGYLSTFSYEDVPIWNNINGNIIRMTSMATPFGVTSIQYQIQNENWGVGNIHTQITVTDPMGHQRTIQQQELANNKNLISIRDFKSNEYQYTIDKSKSRIESIIQPDGTPKTYEYSEAGRRNSIIKGNYRTRYTYDSHGNNTSSTDPLGYTIYYTYDENDNLMSTIDRMGNETTYGYDSNGNLTSTITPVSTNLQSYDDKGKIISSTDPNGNITNYSYDINGYLTTIDYPLGPPTKMINDPVGRPTTITSNGISLSYEYDNLDNIILINHPDGNSEHSTYKVNLQTSYTDRGGRTTTYSYDPKGQLINTDGPEGKIVYTTDEDGNIISININGQITSYDYDAQRRQIRITNPDGTFQSFGYDALGNKISRIDENGTKTTYSYNYTLLTNIDFSDKTPDVSYTYNPNGQIIAMTDGIGTTKYEYENCCNRITKKDGPFDDDDISYTYDAAGNRVTMSLPGLNINYKYDALNRLIDVVSNYASAHHDYDITTNKPKTTTYGNDTYIEYEHDNLGRLISLQNKKTDGSIISGYTHSYDNTSQIKKIEDHEHNTYDYEYDAAYRLVNENVKDNKGKILWHNQFTYDGLGNRLTQNKNGIIDYYTYNVNNQLTNLNETQINVKGTVYGDSITNIYVENIKANLHYFDNNKIEFEAFDIPIDNSQDTVQIYAKVNDIQAFVGDSTEFISNVDNSPDGSLNIDLSTNINGIKPDNINTVKINRNETMYQYDLAGNIIKTISDSEITSYSYDALNRLIRINFPDGSFEEYIYDGNGQRVKIIENGKFKKRYIYDDLFEPIAIKYTDMKNQYLTRDRKMKGGIGGIINIDDNFVGNKYYYFNKRGDIVNIVKRDSVITMQVYDSFGKRKFENGLADSEFGFSTKEYDNSSGLYYFGARFYSTKIGRWITRDPIGFKVQEYNLYNYARNNPINYVDPLGLESRKDCLSRCEQENIEDWEDDFTVFGFCYLGCLSRLPNLYFVTACIFTCTYSLYKDYRKSEKIHSMCKEKCPPDPATSKCDKK